MWKEENEEQVGIQRDNNYGCWKCEQSDVVLELLGE